tara:strand:+ start:929 stop:2611 length:1683 start_codon:yes stop_codon:yes gene_type:complete
MAVLQENIFDIVKRAKSLDFRTELTDWQQLSFAQSSTFESMYRNGMIFKQFKSIEDSFKTIDEVRKDPSNFLLGKNALNRIGFGEFDSSDTFIKNLNEEDKSNIQTKEISKNILQNIKSFIQLGGLYANDRLIVTQDKRGMFDFGLASLGLYRPIEYYSDKLAQEIKNGNTQNKFINLADGIVDANKVEKNSFGLKSIFVYTQDGKSYQCEKRQKGTTSVYEKFSDKCELKPNKDGLYITYYKNSDKVFNGENKTKLKYASTNKKSYLIYNKKEDDVKFVDLFMPINFLTSSDSVRALSLLPLYLIAGTLEEYGIQVRISAMRVGSDSNTTTAISIPVKEYNQSTTESFDRVFNVLAKENIADSYFAFFKIFESNTGIQAPPTNDKSSGFDKVRYTNSSYMNDLMQRYKNWSNKNKEKDFFNTKVVNPNFQFAVPTNADLPMDSGSVVDSDMIFANLHRTFFMFYYYMDFLAIEMIPMQNFVKAIDKRFTDDKSFKSLFEVPNTTKEKKELILNYVTTILKEKYAPVSGGFYGDTSEQTEKKNKDFESKIYNLKESVNSL